MFAAGYWPSYNVPFYPVIYNLSGTLDVLNSHSSLRALLSYQVSARANIFRRDQSKVVDIKSAQEFSRYNGMYLRQYSSVMGQVTAVLRRCYVYYGGAGALGGHRRPSSVRPSVRLMSRTSALTRKLKGLGRRHFAQAYPRSHATPTPTSRSKVKVTGRGHIVAAT